MIVPHGQLHADMTASQAVTGAPAKLTLWSSLGQHSTSSDGDKSVVPDIVNDKLVLHNAGRYLILFDASVYGGGGRELDFFVYVDGVKQAGMGARVTMCGSQRRVAGFHAIIDLPANALSTNDVEIWVSAALDDGVTNDPFIADEVYADYAQFTALRLQ